MAGPYTKSDIVKRALQIINRIGFGEEPDGDTNAFALEQYESMHARIAIDFADMHRTGSVRWSIDSVPAEYYPDVAMLLASELVGPLRASAETTQMVRAAAAEADTSIRTKMQRNVRFPVTDPGLVDMASSRRRWFR
jgi:hypothetical protein